MGNLLFHTLGRSWRRHQRPTLQYGVNPELFGHNGNLKHCLVGEWVGGWMDWCMIDSCSGVFFCFRMKGRASLSWTF